MRRSLLDRHGRQGGLAMTDEAAALTRAANPIIQADVPAHGKARLPAGWCNCA